VTLAAELLTRKRKGKGQLSRKIERLAHGRMKYEDSYRRLDKEGKVHDITWDLTDELA